MLKMGRIMHRAHVSATGRPLCSGQASGGHVPFSSEQQADLRSAATRRSLTVVLTDAVF